jgi:hypothetical protein
MTSARPKWGPPRRSTLETVTGRKGRNAGLRALDGSRSPDPDPSYPNPVLRVIRGNAEVHEERTTGMQQAPDTPRKTTITLDTERGPYEANVTEYLWDLGDGPEPARFISAPGWALGIDDGEPIKDDCCAPGGEHYLARAGEDSA